ncbi:porin PorA family protein [Streptomyces sp. NPDC002779]|uniref:porin PorA family protein n=1 Tax=Streptomyces sp. NPDC002779 TaxID=3364664 RepID=UPI0036740B81
MRRTSWVLTGTAVVLVAASAVTRFTVHPALHQVPADAKTTFRYEGTATLLDAAALAAGDMDKAFLRDVPVILDRRIEVRDVDGRTAVVSDHVALRGRDGTEMSTSQHTWAVDRRDLTERAAPAGSGAEKHKGLVIAWPLEPDKRDYRFWDTGTRTVSPARYEGTESVHGREAYVYGIESTGLLADPATAGSLPRTLPREAVLGLSAALPAKQRPEQQELAGLPKAVPLSYTSTTKRRGWVDADTGLSLDGTLHQRVVAQTQGADGPVALFPVTDVDVRGADASVRQQADDATTTGRLLWVLGIGGPVGLLAVALMLVVLALVMARRRVRPGTRTEAACMDRAQAAQNP